LIQKNFPSGKTIINDYTDPADPTDKSRSRQIRTPEGNIDFTYLCSTKIESISKGTESIAYGYDGKLVTSETLAGTLNQSLAYSYNHNFDVSSFTYAGGTTNYGYDNDGLLTEAGVFTITRNADNGLPESVTGGALALARTFNGYGEIASQNLALNSLNVASWSLTRDPNGRITDKTETVDGATSGYVYTYDTMGRLLTVTKDSVLVEEYQYDLNGTRTYEMNSLRGIAGRSYSYSDEDHLLSAGSVTYTYDEDGFLTSKTDGSGITIYDYSSRGELLSVDMPIADAAPESRKVIAYTHDPIGRRIAKMVDEVIVEKCLWQGLTRLLAVYDGFDNLLMRFEYADGRMPLAMTAEGVTYFLTYDQVGSLRMVADSAGNVVKKINYDAFGNIIEDTNPAFMVPFGFSGGLHDRDTGLIRFGYRDYDPDIGRWTAKDPIGFAGGATDLYGYVLNDPANFIDPTGEYGLGGAIIGAIAGGYGGALSGIQSGNLTSGIIGGVAGAAAGAILGTFMPQASSAVGGMIGGAISGAFGGTVGGATTKALSDPCASIQEIGWAAVKGGGVGALTGALGGGFSGAAEAVGLGAPTAVGAAGELISAPIGWGLGMIE
jgi:RHS repeat-associated protein